MGELELGCEHSGALKLDGEAGSDDTGSRWSRSVCEEVSACGLCTVFPKVVHLTVLAKKCIGSSADSPGRGPNAGVAYLPGTPGPFV